MVYRNKKLGSTILIVILSPFLVQTTSEPRENGSPKFIKTLSNWITKRSHMLWPKNGLVFPPTGTKLILNPMLEIPVIDSDSFGIGSTFKMSYPLTVRFDKLSLADSFGSGGSWHLMSFNELSNLHRYKRSLPDEGIGGGYSNSTAANICNRLSSERITIFRKLESLFDSYGLGRQKTNGKSCLLRTICEIHEYPMVEGYGILGELVTHLFSVGRFADGCQKDSSSLADYMKAEIYGRKGRCDKYYRMCDKSLFVSISNDLVGE